MLPALARRAIETYSDPGDLVVDPMCGIGTTLVEAADLERRAVGVELEGRWAKLAAANLDKAHRDGRARAQTRVIQGDASRLPRLLSTDAQDLIHRAGPHTGKLARMAYGQADLILTSPPYACEIADICADIRNKSEPLRRHDTTNYSPDRRNLGHARGNAYLAAMTEIYRVCAATLKPGGFFVCVTKNMRARGALCNLSGDTIALCESTGLLYWQHVIGLLATVHDSELVMRPSLWQTLHIRRYRAQGDRTQVVAHEDVLVFRKPQAHQTSAAARRRAA
jgi:modification methylase